MRTLGINVRWADNTETLKQHLFEGLQGVQAFAKGFDTVKTAAATALDNSVLEVGILRGALKAAQKEINDLSAAWAKATTPAAKDALAKQLGEATVGAKALRDALKDVGTELDKNLKRPLLSGAVGNLKVADAQQRAFASQAAEDEKAEARRRKAMQDSAKAAAEAAKAQAKAAEAAAKAEVEAAEKAAKRKMDIRQRLVKSEQDELKRSADAQKKAAVDSAKAWEDAEKRKAKAAHDAAKESERAQADAQANSIARMRALPEQLRSIGYAATTFLTLPIVGAATAAIKFGTDFEATTLKIRNLSNITTGELGNIRTEILKMAPEVGMGPEALAQAMLAVTSTGLKGAAALDTLKLSAKMSAVGMGDAAVNARLLTSITRAYGEEVMPAAKAAELLFKIVKDGNADAAELSGTLGRVVGMAATFKIGLADIGTYIASFTRLGVSTAEAVTSVRSVLQALELKKPSNDAIAALNSVGLSFQTLRANITDMGFTKAMQDLFSRFKGHEEDLQPLIANVRGLSGALGVFVSQAGSVNVIYDHLVKSSYELEDAFGETTKTAEFKFKQLRVELEKLGISLAVELLPKLIALIEKGVIPGIKSVEDWVAAWNKLPGPVQNFTLLILGLVAVGGPVMIGLGALARAINAINILLFGANVAAEWSLVSMLTKFGIWVGGLSAAAATAGATAGAAWYLGFLKYAFPEDPTKGIQQVLSGGYKPDVPAGDMKLYEQAGKGTTIRPFGYIPPEQRSGFVAGGTPDLTDIEKRAAAIRGLTDLVNELTEAQRLEIRERMNRKEPTTAIAREMKLGTEVVAMYIRQVKAGTTGNDEYGRSLKEIANARREVAAAKIPVEDVLPPEKIKELRELLEDTNLPVSTLAMYFGVANSQISIFKENVVDLGKELAKVRKIELGGDREVKPLGGKIPLIKPGKEGEGINLKNLLAVHKIEQTGDRAVSPSMFPGRIFKEDPKLKFEGPLTTSFKNIAEAFPQMISQSLMQAFSTGGSMKDALKGAFAGIASTAGTSLMSNIFGKPGDKTGLLKNMSGLLGTLAGAAMPVIGALAGPMLAAVMKLFDHSKRDAKRIAAKYGTEIGDAAVDAIQATMKDKKMTMQAATIFNVDQLFPTVTKANVAQATQATRDIFSMIQTGQFTVAQGTEALDKIFPKLAEAATDSYGFISNSLKEVIALNEKYGTQSKEIASFLKSQGAAAVEASNDMVASLTPQIEGWTELKKKIDDAQKALADKETSPSDRKKAAEELTKLLAEQKAHAAAVKGELADMGTVALATFGAAVAAGHTFNEALAMAAPGLQQLAEAFDALGLKAEDAALSALLMQATLLKNVPQLLKGVAGLGNGFAALSNLGLLNTETFGAMQRTGLAMYTRIQGEVAKLGGSTKDALLPMQDYLHKAQEAAAKYGYELDENTQMMIDQSQQLGIWKEVGKSAADKQLESQEKLIGSLDTLIGKVERLINTLLGIPEEINTDINTNYTETGTPPGGPGGGGNEEGRPPGGDGDGGREQYAAGGVVQSTGRFPRLPSGDSEQIWATPGELIVTSPQQAQFAMAVAALDNATRKLGSGESTTLAPVIVMVDRGASDAEIIEATVAALPQRIRRNNPSGLRGDMLNALGMASTTWTGK